MAAPNMQEDLRRELGFWDALTIGAGTMIGAGIFLLSGIALQLSGPAATLSFLGAGIVCMITAASAAELATGMPTSGGDYYFVSRSMGPALGAISGIGIWLSLTFAIAFYLFGMGEYLARFLPVTPFWGAVAGGVALTALNVIGARESGRTQVVLVLFLLGILGGFAVYGAIRLEPGNLLPFFPHGAGPILPTTALVFVSFLGFVKIAAVAEEIREPEKNLPRALIGSVALVTVLYLLILVVIAGLFPQQRIHEVSDPLVSAARLLFGPAGGVLIIFAGLLATLSSANASILASSRINLAMARDRLVPGWLSAIHPRLMTPHRAIVLTGILALLFLLLDSLEDLAKIASSLQLYSYAALNVGCVMLRAGTPEWYRPTFRTPGSPFLQLAAAVACIGIILVSGPFAQLAVVTLIVLSLAWYFFWGRSRMDVEHGLPTLRLKIAQFGGLVFFQAPVRHAHPAAGEPTVAPRPVGAEPAREIVVAVANPEHGTHLLHLGRMIATGAREGGVVHGVHLVNVPLQTPLKEADRWVPEADALTEEILARLDEKPRFAGPAPREEAAGEHPTRRPLEDTTIEAVSRPTHDVFRGLVAETHAREADLLLMGWEGGFSLGRVYRSPIQWIMSNVRADLAVLKDRGLGQIRSIVVPWGGGLHARLGLEIAVRVGRTSGARLTLLRLVREGVDPEKEKAALSRAVAPVVGDYPGFEIHIQPSDNVEEGILEHLEEHGKELDLVVIGASRESRIRKFLFGSVPDLVAEQAPSSVLMVRRYLPEHWSVEVADRLKVLKESVGGTTSPDEESPPGP